MVGIRVLGPPILVTATSTAELAAEIKDLRSDWLRLLVIHDEDEESRARFKRSATNPPNTTVLRYSNDC